MPVVPRVIVRVRDLPEPLTYAVQPGSCLLIGRLPDPSRLVTETGELAESITGMQVLTARIDSPRVSGNHLLAVCAPGGNMSLYEMQSRNGTSLRLYPGQPVRLRGDVTVDLAFRGGSVAMLGEPRPADWTDESDFGMQVVA